MFARVTLLEIDTMRSSVDDALEQFRAQTVPRLRAQPGYLGVWALTTEEGKALVMSLWATEADADVDTDAGTDRQFYEQELGRFATLFRSPPGREEYRVAFVDQPAVQGT